LEDKLRITRITAFLAVLIGFSSPVNSQVTKSKPTPNAQPSFSIVISGPKDVVKTGSPIAVELTKTNLTNHEINTSTVRRFGGPYEIDVRDEHGDLRADTEAARQAKKDLVVGGRAFQSVIFSNLKPGEVDHDRIDVQRYIDLSPPGKYTIQLHQFDHESKTTVKSNTVTVTVTVTP
jgi:hypothetical protein